ncbi:hypothetical protein GQ44DRAFT_421739 [Phaeosphaeriaceae sp. PMI808]|nr:hypothetical protein GQ44DRAFT_421739 [Phaeosphaeriaceae sp. PMI808]
MRKLQIPRARTLLKTPTMDDREVQHFRAKVVADQKQLDALLAQRIQHAEEEETCRRNEMASAILNALKNPSPSVQNNSPTFEGSIIAENKDYMPVTSILAASERLLKEYERLDKMTKDMQEEQKEPITEEWNMEIKEAERRLTMGARVALRNVKKVLGADVESHGTCSKGMDEDEEKERAEQGAIELNYELQKSLRYAERGVKRMVKGLPANKDY